MSVASDSMLARDTHLFVDLFASLEMRNILWAREKKQTEFGAEGIATKREYETAKDYNDD